MPRETTASFQIILDWKYTMLINLRKWYCFQNIETKHNLSLAFILLSIQEPKMYYHEHNTLVFGNCIIYCFYEVCLQTDGSTSAQSLRSQLVGPTSHLISPVLEYWGFFFLMP